MKTIPVVDEGDNNDNNPNIYNVERDNRLYTGIQQVVARSTTLDNRKCVENPFFFQSGSVIICFKPEFFLLSSPKQNIPVLNILRVVSV
jgi:hypothetical protein